MKNYFANCTTLDEAKALYKKLAFQLHPDTSGKDTKAEFQEMQSQFEKFTPTTEKYKGEYDSHSAKEYMTIIEDLMHIEGIIIEICGSFIWLSGETKAVKEQIRAIKNDSFKPAQWHTQKLMWFFAPVGYRRFSGKIFDMEEIRNKYGSETFTGKGQTKIAA
jgi:curved DNA-binding protein CbpA